MKGRTQNGVKIRWKSLKNNRKKVYDWTEIYSLGGQRYSRRSVLDQGWTDEPSRRELERMSTFDHNHEYI